MLSADTNVWARAYLNDNLAQARKARTELAAAQSNEGLFVPLIVLAELSWVLRRRWEKKRILDAIEALLQTRGITIESPTVARRALDEARKGSVGFADHLIAEVAFENGAKEVLTFDKAFARKQKVRRLK